jgi:DHA2 family multidrug resistance protein-like MFS transporter
MMAVCLGSLDQSIANTALPAIADGLQHTPAESVWILHAYQLAVVATLLPFASLGDLWGAFPVRSRPAWSGWPSPVPFKASGRRV